MILMIPEIPGTPSDPLASTSDSCQCTEASDRYVSLPSWERYPLLSIEGLLHLTLSGGCRSVFLLET